MTDSFTREPRRGGESRPYRGGLGLKRAYSSVGGGSAPLPFVGGFAHSPVVAPCVTSNSILTSDLSSGDKDRIPKAVEALGQRSSETWNVLSIVDTLARWYLVRNSEIRQMRADLRAAQAEAFLATSRLGDVSSALTDARNVISDVREERDRYRAQRDEVWYGSGRGRRGYYLSTVRSSATNARAVYPSWPQEQRNRPDPYQATRRDPYEYLRGTGQSHEGSASRPLRQREEDVRHEDGPPPFDRAA